MFQIKKRSLESRNITSLSVYSDNRKDTLIQIYQVSLMKQLVITDVQLLLIKRSNTAADILSERTLIKLQLAG